MIKRHTISFYHAFAGLSHSLRTQPNFVVHLSISLLAILAGWYLRINPLEWLIISITIFTGLVIELINTAIESTVDLVTKEFHPMAKIAKDTSAAAMLVYAFGSIVIALIIFLPKWLSI